MRKTCWLVSLSLCAAACVGVGPAHESERGAIVDGELTESLPQVVAITPRRVQCDDAATVLCSGTLIAPDAVLSAAHCFDSRRPGLAYEVAVGSTLTGAADRVFVLEVVKHPEFDERTRANDVAILWLASPIDGVAPLPLPDPSSMPPPIGARVELAGFGATEPGAPPDGAKRVGVGRVANVDANVIEVEPDPAVSCVGDSGGPLFAGEGELVGIASSGDTGCRELSVYATIAPAVTTFIEPSLAIGPAERPPVETACTRSCDVDADCPVGFVCVPALDGRLECTLPGERAGSLADACTEDAGCRDGFCAVSNQPEGCRCYAPCAATEGGAAGGGCAATAARGGSAIWALLLGVLVASRRRV